ncbi:MAG: DegT/DnrJ/EryC1/StrS family aminotransferase [Thermoleophilia bacterium]
MPSLGSMTLDEDDVDLANKWLDARELWQDASVVTSYETAFARWNGSRHAIAFMGGRVALSACIHALGLERGDEVILPGYTCVVVPNAFHFAGIRIVYCDIELETFGLDADVLEQRITSRTKAIMLHHLYGLVSRDYERIIELARSRGLKVIEDCSQSTGAELDGIKIGNRGDLAIYSSEQSKIFNTVQGGMATSNDDELARRLAEFQMAAPSPSAEYIRKLLHNVLLLYYQCKHRQRWVVQDWAELRYGSQRLVSTTRGEEQGQRPAHYGEKMPPPIAALGLNQLRKVDAYNSRRRATAGRWDEWCEMSGYHKPLIVADSKPVFLRYPVLVEPQKKLDLSWARSVGVYPGVWFVSNLHPAKRTVEDCPNADIAVKQCINMPCLEN